MPRTLRYGGLETWLEDTQGRSIPLYKSMTIDEGLHRISGSAHLEPKTSFTLHWRRETGLEPISALCQVFLQNGYFLVDSNEFCAATNVMDENRRVTQSRSTHSYMNPPYKRHGCLKAGRACDFSAKYPGPFSMPLSGPCKLRLEIRRLNGETCPLQWIAGSVPATVANLDQLDIVDDSKEGFLPYAEFIIEIPDFTSPQGQYKIGTSHLKRNSSAAKETIASGSQPQMTLRSRRREGGTPSVRSSQNVVQHTPNGLANAHENNSQLPDTAASPTLDNGTVIHRPRKTPGIEKVISSDQPHRSQTHVERWIATTSLVASPEIIDVDRLKSEEDEIKEETKSIVIFAAGIAESSSDIGKRKARDWDEEKESIEAGDLKSETADDIKLLGSSIELAKSYKAIDKLEKELTKKLEEKIKMKKKSIKQLQRLLDAD